MPAPAVNPGTGQPSASSAASSVGSPLGGDTGAVLQLLQQQYGTSIAGSYTWQRYTYYDYNRLNPTGTNLLQFFTNIQGSVDPVSGLGKTSEQTNLPIARQIGNPFILRRIRTHVNVVPKVRQTMGTSNAIPAQTDWFTGVAVVLAPLLQGLGENGVLQVLYGQSRQVQINKPFMSCPPCGGVDITSVASNTKTMRWWQQSFNQMDGYVLDPIQFIEASQIIDASIVFPLFNTPTLSVTISATPYPIAVDVGLLLDGYLIRNRQ